MLCRFPRFSYKLAIDWAIWKFFDYTFVRFPAGSTASDECGILYDVLHERLFESIQLLISWFVALNSFFNPIVYAIWFKPFRRLLKEVLNKIRIKLFPEKSEFSWLKQSQVTTIQTSWVDPFKLEINNEKEHSIFQLQ